MQPAEIDILACYRGVFIGIEVKAPGGRATARQLDILSSIRNAGGRALIAFEPARIARLLYDIDEELDGKTI